MALNFNLQWFHENFEKIRVDEDRVKFLEELQIAISNSSQSVLALVIAELQLEIIFDCLNTTDKVQLELTIAVIKKFLSLLDPSDVFKLYGVPLGRALEHPDIEAKRLVLNELNRAARHLNLLVAICQEVPLVVSIIECLKNDLSLASAAIHFLSELGKIEAGTQVLFSSPIVEHLKQTATTNETVKYRIYEIVVDVSTNSVNGLVAAANCNLLIDLMNELQSDEILIQLTCLETISKLALTDHGLQFLKEKRFFDHLSDQLSDMANLSGLLVSGYIKFFGNVAQFKPKVIFNDYPRAMDLVFQLYDSDDPVISNVALETVGYIASNPEGKVVLNQYGAGSQMQNVIPILGSVIATQTMERKVVALNVLANLMHLEVTDQTEEILEITKKWFFMLPENSMMVLKNVCEKPFKELKLAGLLVLHAVAVQPWGQDEINKCSGLVEYLLDRNEEGDMNCKTAKFNIVQTIYNSQFSRRIFSSDTISRFQVHVRQGIIYAEAKTEVAYEGAM